MNNRIKIVYLIRSLKRCGPVNVLFHIVENLNRSIFDPIIVTFKPEGLDSIICDFQDIDIKVYSERSMIDGIKKIRMILNDDPQKLIIHSHGILPDMVNVLFKRKNVVNISTIHNNPFEDYPMTFGKCKGNLLARLHCFLFRKLIDISCSESVSMDLKERTNLTPLSIRNGVSFNNAITTNGGLKGEKINIVYVGSVSKRKNVDFLIRSVLQIVNYKVTLKVVGDGPEFKALKEKYRKYPNIVFTGFKKNTVPFFQKADIVASASRSEGLPMAALEALSFGKPLLLSDIRSHKEIIHQGSFGELFKNNDTDNFVNSFGNVIKLVNKEKNIYREAKIIFSDEVMSKKYQELYVKAVKGNLK